ncbi:MAG: hypothetical protein ABSB29_09495 [Nitrososphaerales archaeon]
MISRGNIVECPDCKATLIDEELQEHRCRTREIQWFFEGDEFWGNDGSGWFGINIHTLASPEMKRGQKSPEDEPEPSGRLVNL